MAIGAAVSACATPVYRVSAEGWRFERIRGGRFGCATDRGEGASSRLNACALADRGAQDLRRWAGEKEQLRLENLSFSRSRPHFWRRCLKRERMPQHPHSPTSRCYSSKIQYARSS